MALFDDDDDFDDIEELDDVEELDDIEEIGGLSSGLDALAEAEKKSGSKKPAKPQPKKEQRPAAEKRSAEKKPAEKPPTEKKAKAETPKKPETPKRDHSRAGAARPGEEDLLRSPLLLTLLGAGAALALIGAIFWFLAGDYAVQAQFDQAKALYDEGNFRGAIQELESFAVAYPKDDRSLEARRLAGIAKIRQYSEGAAPNYTEAMVQLRNFVTDQRDRDDFEQVHPDIFDHAKNISLGSAKAAGERITPDLLKISAEAKTVMKTYAPKDVAPTETLEQIEAQVRSSEASILKDGVYKQHIAEIQLALGKAATTGEEHTPPPPVKPLKAMQVRQDLLVRYPEFDRDKKVRELMDTALTAEKALAVVDDAGVDANHEARSTTQGLTLLFQGRTRADEVSVGQCVISVARDCVYGLDLVTGAPVWRHEIGLDSPFFPLIDASTSSVIAFDTRFNEVICLKQHTGELLWRQDAGSRGQGDPYLSEGTVYLATEQGELLAIELESGRLRTRLQFSQPITHPIEIKSGHLVVVGHEDVLYELTKRPLECVQVHYFGQPAGSVQAPLTTMGSYLLMIENLGENAKLRLLETNTADKPFVEVAAESVNGRVFDQPVIRGRDLFIPSSGERITAFSVSDDPGQPPLTIGPSYQGKSAGEIAIHMLPGPDRQLWIASVALSRLRLTTEALQPDGEPVAQGLSTQPLVYEAGYLFNARSRPYTDSVILTRTDRDEMTSDWQAVLGSKPIAFAEAGGNLIVVNDAGVVFRVGERQWSGKFVTESAARLPVHEDLVAPLRAVPISNNRIAVACGDPEPRVWIVGNSGQIEGSPLIPQAPEANPLFLGGRLIIPMAGRLHAVKLSGQAAIQDLTLPTGESHPWRDVIATGEDRAVGVTTDGILMNIRLQDSPKTHLAEAGQIELGSAVNVGLGASDQFVAVADESRTITVLKADLFEQVGTRTFDQPISSRPVVVGTHILVESGLAELHSLDAANGLQTRWTFGLAGSPLTGALEVGGKLVLAQQSGVVSVVDPATGDVISSTETGSLLSLGPFQTSKGVMVATVDDTLIPVTLPQ